VTPLIIKRKPIQNSPLCEIQDQLIYVFSKSVCIQEMLKKYTSQKSYFFSGVEIAISSVSADQVDAERRKCADFAIGLSIVQGIEKNHPKHMEELQNVK
jgi:hypothetical protein